MGLGPAKSDSKGGGFGAFSLDDFPKGGGFGVCGLSDFPKGGVFVIYNYTQAPPLYFHSGHFIRNFFLISRTFPPRGGFCPGGRRGLG